MGEYFGPVIGDQKEKMRQIVSGLNHLHMKGIVHRALQPENIFVSYSNGTDPPRLKLGNFGFVSVSHSALPFWQQVAASGTNEYWMAPEIYSEEAIEFTEEMDLFPLGLLLGFIVLSGGRHVFEAGSKEATIAQIKERMSMTLIVEHLKNVDNSAGIFNIIQALVNPEPLARPSTKKVLKMTFFIKPIEGAKKRQLLETPAEIPILAKRSKLNGTFVAPEVTETQSKSQ